MSPKKTITIIAASAATVVAVFFVTTVAIPWIKKMSFDKGNNPNVGCITNVEMFTMPDTSLAGLVVSGEIVSVGRGYFSCNDPKREELTLYKEENGNSTLKVLKGIPGDTVRLKGSEARDAMVVNGTLIDTLAPIWYIEINGAIIMNSEQKPYELGRDDYRFFSSYLADYSGVIPEGAYLLLDNRTQRSGGQVLGLIGRDALIGKALKTN